MLSGSSPCGDGRITKSCCWSVTVPRRPTTKGAAFANWSLKKSSLQTAAILVGHWSLGEDFSFFERLRRCGYKIFADTTIPLRHIGSYGYSWEEAGSSVQRHSTYVFRLH